MRGHAAAVACALLTSLLVSAPVLRADPGVAIDTPPVLPWATVATAYSLNFAASGGTAPYTWTLASGSLPPGFSLNSSGLLSGIASQTGTYFFTVTVTDGSGFSASQACSLLVTLPPTPAISITGLRDNVNPAEQLPIDVQLSGPYPLEITGSITLTFEPDAVNPCDDPAIQFSTGGRVLNFTIPAGQTSASWNATYLVQTGTVAGKIRLRLAYWAGGVNLTPTIPPVRTITIGRAAPVITTVQVIKGGGGFQVVVKGYATPREVKQAGFEFAVSAGGGVQKISVPVSLENTFKNWFSSETSFPYGSAFTYTQPFTVQGDLSAITSVSVTLSNTNGTSSAVSANF